MPTVYAYGKFMTATEAAAAMLVGAAALAALGCGATSSSPNDAPAPAPTAAPATASATAGAHAGAASGGDFDPDQLVQMTALADADAIAAGQTVTVAARFDIAEGWHLYWENPGESGLATELEVSAPDGFELGPVRYPGPIRFTSPGPVVSYGYADEVVLSLAARAPATLAPGPQRFVLSGYWLACREVCVRGQAEVALTLPAGPQAPAPASQLARLEAHRARLPRPFSELAGSRHSVRRADDALTWHIEIDGAEALSFFPHGDSQLDLRGQAPAGDGALSVTLRPSATRLRGVVAVGVGQGAAFYTIDLPAPPR